LARKSSKHQISLLSLFFLADPFTLWGHSLKTGVQGVLKYSIASIGGAGARLLLLTHSYTLAYTYVYHYHSTLKEEFVIDKVEHGYE
jgi:hypothetical protein